MRILLFMLLAVVASAQRYAVTTPTQVPSQAAVPVFVNGQWVAGSVTGGANTTVELVGNAIRVTAFGGDDFYFKNITGQTLLGFDAISVTYDGLQNEPDNYVTPLGFARKLQVTVDTVAELLALEDFPYSRIAFVNEAGSLFGFWFYCPDLLTPDNGDTIRRPNHIVSDSTPGRWVFVGAPGGGGGGGSTDIVYTVPNMDALRALDPANVPYSAGVALLGYYYPGDGGYSVYVKTNTISGTNALAGRIVALGGAVSWQLMETQMVNIKQFGAVGDGNADDVASINAAVLYAATATPILSTFVPAGRYLVNTQVLLPSNSRFWGLGPPSKIIRGDTRLYAPFATIRNLNAQYPSEVAPNFDVPIGDTNIHVSGIWVEAKDTNRLGQGFQFLGVHNLRVENNTVVRSYGDFAFGCWAQDFIFSNNRVMSNQVVHEDGIHVNGRYGLVTDNVLHTGDDMTAIGESQDIASEYITFANNNGSSVRGQLFRIVSSINQGNGSTYIRNINVINCSGTTGRERNGGIYLAEDGTPRGAFYNINIGNITLTANDPAFTNKSGTLLNCLYVRGGSNINFHNITASGAAMSSIVVDLPFGPINYDNVTVGGAQTNYDLVVVTSGRGQPIRFRNSTLNGLLSSTNVFNIDQADLILENNDIYGTNVYIAMRQQTNASRIAWVQNNRFWGPGVTPWSSVGSQAFMRDFRFTDNWIEPNGSFPSGLAFSGNTEFGPNVKISDNTGLGEQSRFTRSAGNNTYIWGNGTTGHSTVTLTAGNAVDRRLDIQDANISALQASTSYPTNLVINGTGGFVQLGSSGAAVNGVMVGSGTPDPAAAFQVDSTTQGIRPPRMIGTQRDAIGSPPDGLFLYNLTANKLNVRENGTWVAYEPTITAGTTGQYWRGDKTWQTLDKAVVGLGSVENTALSTWAGSANITTVGTLGAGTVPVARISGTLPVANGGSGATTLTGYVKGNGTSAFTASATVPWSDVSSKPTVYIPAGFQADNSGTVLPTGMVKGTTTAEQAGTITGWSISVDTGTATVRVWKRATGTAIPTVANNISTSGLSISSGTHIRSSTTSDFTTTSVAAGDIIMYEITAVSGATWMSFNLEITAN